MVSETINSSQDIKNETRFLVRELMSLIGNRNAIALFKAIETRKQLVQKNSSQDNPQKLLAATLLAIKMHPEPPSFHYNELVWELVKEIELLRLSD